MENDTQYKNQQEDIHPTGKNSETQNKEKPHGGFMDMKIYRQKILAISLILISSLCAFGTAFALFSFGEIIIIYDPKIFVWVSVVSVAVGFLAGIVSYYTFDKLNTALNAAQQYRVYVTQLNEKFVKIISEISAYSNWKLVAHRASNEIAKAFEPRNKHVIVNILSLKANQLYFVASSSPNGQELIKDNYHFPADVGITGWVVKNNKECLVLDVKNDPEKRYFYHSAFPNVKSEMAVPIKYGENKIIGIIDIQSQASFIGDDMLVLPALGAQLGEIYRRLEFLEIRKKIADLSVSLAKRVITIHDLGMLLKETGIVAKDVLGADVISYYYMNPSDGQLKGPYVAGELLHPEIQIGTEDVLSDEFLTHILERGDIQYFEQAAESLQYRQNEKERISFIERENIESFVAIPLVTQSGTVGLMFVNFRAQQLFDDEFKGLIEIFSALSSLAIQNCQVEEITALVRHDQLIRDLHDTVQHRLLGAESALNTLLNAAASTEDKRNSGIAAMNYVASARKIIYNLERGGNIFTLKTIFENISWHANLIRSIYKIEVSLSLPEIDFSVPIMTWVGNQIEYVIEEMVYNAVQHANTPRIDIVVNLEKNDLLICVKDKGVGFDMDNVKRGMGLDNMRQRVETYLNGSLNIDAQPGQGTNISVRFPVIIDFNPTEIP